jgi:RNA polymerase sigma factor for flagellar operon FliA
VSAPEALQSDGAEHGLWHAFKQGGSASARERLFSRYAGFAVQIAARLYRRKSVGDIELADLRQLAYAGLLEAIDRFDPDRGVPFRAFAARRVSGSVLDGIAKLSEKREQLSWRAKMRRERVRSLAAAEDGEISTADAMARIAEIAVGLALGFMLEDVAVHTEVDIGNRPPTAYDSLVWKEMVTQLRRQVEGLPEREQLILRRHYMDGVSFDQLAALLDLTKGRISQLHRAALSLLRKRMDRRGHFRMER